MNVRTLIIIIISAIVVGVAVGVVANFWGVNLAIIGIITITIAVPMSIGILAYSKGKYKEELK